ncbi:protein DpdG [Cupriavidus sp. Marseille-Q8015]
MSLLNITNDGLPNILVQLHAAVLRTSKPIPKEDLLDTVAPPSVVEDEGKQARQTLTRWTQLGLFQETDGAISVSDRPPGRLRSPQEMLAFTRRTACARVLAPENNPDFWAAEGALAADLTRGLAWMMVQDIYRTDFSKFEEQESKQILDSNRCLLKNSTRRPGLQYWARFLGFSQQPFADIDPTVAVRDVLPKVLAEGEDMHATGFLDRLAGALPVMDKGIWQEEMIAALDPNALARMRQGQLSTALSRALLNLRESGELQLQRRADVGSSIVLTGVRGIRSDLEFHWIARPQAGAK